MAGVSEASAARRAWLPSADDPLDKLPPTARRLLAAARDLLAEGGFQALSLQAIARAAGESKGSVSYHFRNKRGLVVAGEQPGAGGRSAGAGEETH